MKHFHKSNENKIKQFSSAQLHYVRSKRKEHFIIVSTQFLILALFLFLWETASARNYIDSFFFSSPSLVVKNTMKMLTDGSLWVHTRITLLEVLVSFILVFCKTRKNYGAFSGSTEQSAKVCPGSTSHCMAWNRKQDHHCSRYVCCHFRFHYEFICRIQ